MGKDGDLDLADYFLDAKLMVSEPVKKLCVLVTM